MQNGEFKKARKAFKIKELRSVNSPITTKSVNQSDFMKGSKLPTKSFYGSLVNIEKPKVIIGFEACKKYPQQIYLTKRANFW